MKKIAVLFIFFFLFSAAPAIAGEEAVNNFSADIRINPDSSLEIIESITYDFADNQKHGIYRDIPYKYETAMGNFKLRVFAVRVLDESGEDIEFKLSKTNGMQRIKIGDPDRTISGVHTYNISYTVRRAWLFEGNSDIFYWNITGNQWPVPIKETRAVVYFPASVNEKDFQANCVFGPLGSTKKCFSERFNYSGQNMVNNITYISEKINPGEGMTVKIDLPKGLVAVPTWPQNARDTLRDNWVLFIPFLTLGIIFYLWYTRGRDPQGRGTIIAQFDAPDNLNPAQVGTIIDEEADKKDISAEIINLAVKGYIKIVRLEKKILFFDSTDYLLEKLKSEDSLANKYERELMKALFAKRSTLKNLNDLLKLLKKEDKSGDSKVINFIERVGENLQLGRQDEEPAGKEVVKLSDLKDKFYQALETIKKEIYLSTVEQGYFPRNPNKVRGAYVGIGVILIFGAVWTAGFFGVFAFISFVVSGIIILIMSKFMPVKTKKGVLAKEHILGLKDYLQVAEKDRIKFHNAPAKDPKQFEKLLPFAMVLGVEKEWAEQFKDIYKDNPDWYSDPSGSSFTAVALAGSLGSFQTRANSTLASKPSSGGSGSSGGGGFSGGGFGGGGGGSW